jgi:hypothetical protein
LIELENHIFLALDKKMVAPDAAFNDDTGNEPGVLTGAMTESETKTSAHGSEACDGLSNGRA